MKVVVAVDSFKGCLSSMQAGNAVRGGVLRAFPEAEVVVRPLADGGEGTVDALVEGLSGERIPVRVTGPLGEPVDCEYGVLPGGMAVIEMASACGLPLVPPEKRDPRYTTTYGLGEMILHAAGRGCRSFLIGIGGSATNDGGVGMLTALGFRFLTAAGESAGIDGLAAAKVDAIDDSAVDPRIRACRFRIACDVNNPLFGPEGASYVYGPQKGATPEIAAELDRGLRRFSEATRRKFGRSEDSFPGTGAAGGLGYAFLNYLPAQLEPGVGLVLDAVRLADDLVDADFVVTGEGRMDRQTSMGKAPMGVARLGKRYGAVTLAFAGTTADDAAAVNENGVDAYFAILQSPLTLREAMEPERACKNLASRAEQVFRAVAAVKSRLEYKP